MEARPRRMGRVSSVEIEIGGERVVLLASRAAYWPARRTLLVADLHLGKCEALRANGVPLPDGVLREQISRLDAAVKETGAERVLVLGDLLHAPIGTTGRMVECFAAWRATPQPSGPVAMALVPGNHDRMLGAAAAAWGLEVLPETHVEGPFTFTHIPPAGGGVVNAAAGTTVWCGHLHPAVTVRSAADAIKLPCFWVREGLVVLPAFSAFTGGAGFRRGVGDRVYAVAEGCVIGV